MILGKGSDETPPCLVGLALWGWQPGRSGHTCHNPLPSCGQCNHRPQRIPHFLVGTLRVMMLMLCALLSPVVLRKGTATHFLHVVWSCSIRRPWYEKNCYLRRKKTHLENWWKEQSFYYIIRCPIFNISLAKCLQIGSPFPPSGHIFNIHPPH